MVLLWEDSLALLDVWQEEAHRYSLLQLRRPAGHTGLEPTGAWQSATPTTEGLAQSVSNHTLNQSKKRKREQRSRPLNAMEVQSKARQVAPQAAVTAGLQNIRAWLHASGHATIAAAIATEASPRTASCSMHAEPAQPAGSRPEIPRAFRHSCEPGIPEAAGLSQAQLAELCSVCRAAWENPMQGQLNEACCPTSGPAGQGLRSGAARQQPQQDPCAVGSNWAMLDLPALHKVKHLVKPKLVMCNKHCLLNLLWVMRGKKRFPAGICSHQIPRKDASRQAEYRPMHQCLIHPGVSVPDNQAKDNCNGGGLQQQELCCIQEAPCPDHRACHAEIIEPTEPCRAPNARAGLSNTASDHEQSHSVQQQFDSTLYPSRSQAGSSMYRMEPEVYSGKLFDRVWEQLGPVRILCSIDVEPLVAAEQPLVAQSGPARQRIFQGPCSMRNAISKNARSQEWRLQPASQTGPAASCCGMSVAAASEEAGTPSSPHSSTGCHDHTRPTVVQEQHRALPRGILPSEEQPAGGLGYDQADHPGANGASMTTTASAARSKACPTDGQPDVGRVDCPGDHLMCNSTGRVTTGLPLEDVHCRKKPVTGAGHEGEGRCGCHTESLAMAHGVPVVLPAGARFLMSDIGRLQPLLPRCPGEAFHCIVLDPPWENASVRRGRQYKMLPPAKLLQLPIPSLLHQAGGLVVLWMTNRERLHQFVERHLLPAWGLELIATWWWAKITPSGHPVQPLGATHHHPYEPILLAWRAGYQQWPQLAGLPRHLVLAAEPMQHSRKPHLGPLLQLCLPPAPRCLEMFARELVPGWTSWGNEVLHFQCMNRFTI
ncbi:hypothetical protein WJX74_005012 [Apatococcus lobatus]|uniref:Uncharacterized protein n=1 Tax=Apatococcus lobatus TaxID=904363 RepID=A0AAW1QAM9_9CHLO